MKLTTCLLIFNLLHLGATGYSQTDKVTVNLSNAGIKEFVTSIENQTEYKFLYRDDEVEKLLFNAVAENIPLDKLLNTCLDGLPFDYKILPNNLIVIASDKILQQIAVTGTVTDGQTGERLAGVNIQIEGTTTGAITDAEGAFRITGVNQETFLIFSYVGYNSERIQVGQNTVININLIPDITSLEEVVVVGYGTQKKGSLTGAVEAIQSEKLVIAPMASTSNTLAGRLPGLVSQQSTGLPGYDQAALTIRGFGNALVIVDGIEGNLNSLDPNQIESVSILKDGAASIYGARAGNGVILVTTKRGIIQKPTFTLNSSLTFQGNTMMLKPASSGQQAEMARETHLNQGKPENTAPFTEEEIQNYYNETDPYLFPNTDWYNEIFRDWAPQQQHNLSVRGGSDKIKYYGLLSYLDQETTIKKGGGGYKRYNVQSNMDAAISDNLTLKLNFSSSIQDIPSPGGLNVETSTSENHQWQWLWQTDPKSPAHLPDPTKYSGANGGGTGGAHLTTNMDISGYRHTKISENTMQGGLDYNIKWVKGLSARALVSYFSRLNTYRRFRRPYSWYDYDPASGIYTQTGTAQNAGAQLEESTSELRTLTHQYSLNYDNTFGGNHRITAMALYEAIDYKSHNFYAGRDKFLTPSIEELFAGSTEGQTNNGGSSEMGRASYVGRLYYSYRSKYLLEAIFRADASAKFPEDKRWGYFPSVSLGWVLTEEGFMSGLEVLSNLKLRASYGESGYDDVANFAYLAGYKLAHPVILDKLSPSIASTGLANPNLTWERMKLYNLGLDFALFKNTLYGAAEVFYREREGIAFWNNAPVTRSTSLPSTFGAPMPAENLNSTTDRGFEFSLGTRGKLGEVNYNLSGNISWSRAKWNHYEEPEYTDPDQKRINQRSGQWIDRSFGYISDGLFTNQDEIDNLGYDMDKQGNITLRPGDIRLPDTNLDGIVDFRDQQEIGMGTVPHWMVGGDITLRYKQFDFTALVQGAFGYHAYIRLDIDPSTLKFENRWTPENNDPHALVPRLGGAPTNGVYSDYYYQQAGYLRLKTASLGYNLPKRWLDKIAFNEARVYVSGVNLLTFNKLAKYGVDPEAPNTSRYYPQQRTVSFGVNISF